MNRNEPWNAITDDGWTTHATERDALVHATNALGGGPLPWETQGQISVCYLEGTAAALVFHDNEETTAREQHPEVF